jgi:hypothetical protein
MLQQLAVGRTFSPSGFLKWSNGEEIQEEVAVFY